MFGSICKSEQDAWEEDMCTCICLYDCMNSIMCIAAAAAMKFAPRRVARTERTNSGREREEDGNLDSHRTALLHFLRRSA